MVCSNHFQNKHCAEMATSNRYRLSNGTCADYGLKFHLLYFLTFTAKFNLQFDLQRETWFSVNRVQLVFPKFGLGLGS